MLTESAERDVLSVSLEEAKVIFLGPMVLRKDFPWAKLHTLATLAKVRALTRSFEA